MMTPRYARAPIGQRVGGVVPGNWGKNITLLGAIGSDGLRTLMTVDGGTTGDVFQVFVEQLLLPKLRPGDVVIWDGLSSHKDSRVLQLLEEAKVILVVVPPYSPDLNPIESCWSKIKHWLRKLQPRTRDQLDDTVASAMKQVTSNDTLGWYTEVGYA